jgi:hypothetical protein
VGKAANARIGAAGTILHQGIAYDPWQLSVAHLQAAARTTGLLHDVGKLQDGWQAWAERAQRSLDPAYVHDHPLAHTDFDRENPEDRERERIVNQQGRRPSHAAASAWYSIAVTVALLRQASVDVTAELRAACLAAVLGHHGGWLSATAGNDLGVQPLVATSDAALAEATGQNALPPIAGPRTSLSVRHALERTLDPATHPDAWADWWPIVAFLTRTLRLADQRATSLYGGEN